MATVLMSPIMGRVCELVDCGEPATFGVNGSGVGRFCARHADSGMVDVLGDGLGGVLAGSMPEGYRVSHTVGEPVGALALRRAGDEGRVFCSQRTGVGVEKVRRKRCTYKNCVTYATHGVEGTKARVRCKQHACDGMVELVSRLCRFRGCYRVARYGAQGSKLPVRCSPHAEEGMVNLTRRFCAHKGCSVEIVGGCRGRRRVVCVQHATAGSTEDSGRPRRRTVCGHVGCTRQPSFGVQNSRIGVYCADHAGDDMVCVKYLPCAFERCGRKASFGVEGTRLGVYCSQHADEGMVDVLSKRCEQEGCYKRPSFGFESRGVAVRCSRHADDGMMNLVTKRCGHEGCSKYAIFGSKGSRVRVYCRRHAEAGMVNVTQKPCARDDCLQKAIFGLLSDASPSVCKDHVQSLPEGIKFNFKGRCETPSCGSLARFGPEGGDPFLCSEHKEDGHVRLVGTCRSSNRTYSSAMAVLDGMTEERRSKRGRKTTPKEVVVPEEGVSEAVAGSDDGVWPHEVKLETDIAM